MLGHGERQLSGSKWSDKSRHATDLDGAVLKDETAGQHDLLVCTSDMEVVCLAMVDDEGSNMAAM